MERMNVSKCAYVRTQKTHKKHIGFDCLVLRWVRIRAWSRAFRSRCRLSVLWCLEEQVWQVFVGVVVVVGRSSLRW